jgi:hypothetical protein
MFEFDKYFTESVEDVLKEKGIYEGYKDMYGKTVCSRHPDGTLWEGMNKLDKREVDEMNYLIDNGVYTKVTIGMVSEDVIKGKKMYVITDGNDIYNDSGEAYIFESDKFWKNPELLESYLYVSKDKAKGGIALNGLSSKGVYIKEVIVDPQPLTGYYNLNGTS